MSKTDNLSKGRINYSKTRQNFQFIDKKVDRLKVFL